MNSVKIRLINFLRHCLIKCIPVSYIYEISWLKMQSILFLLTKEIIYIELAELYIFNLLKIESF